MNWIKSLFLPKESSSDILTIRNFLDVSECDEILRLLENYNFIGAHQFENGRHNMEMFVEDQKILSVILKKMNLLRITGTKKVLEYHEPFEFYKYNKGDYILPHEDSSIYFNSGIQSNFTAIIYLNDNYLGGQTFFNQLKRKIKPQKGTLLLFKHNLLHEAQVVKNGTKYIYRSNWFIN